MILNSSVHSRLGPHLDLGAREAPLDSVWHCHSQILLNKPNQLLVKKKPPTQHLCCSHMWHRCHSLKNMFQKRITDPKAVLFKNRPQSMESDHWNWLVLSLYDFSRGMVLSLRWWAMTDSERSSRNQWELNISNSFSPFKSCRNLLSVSFFHFLRLWDMETVIFRVFGLTHHYNTWLPLGSLSEMISLLVSCSALSSMGD